MAKKYYWLKLKDNFFNTKEIKKLRKIAGGDTYTIIYLKLQLLSLKNEGKLFFDGLEETFAEELALEIDEDVDNTMFTLMFLNKCGLLEQVTEDEILLLQTMESIGSETQGAERVRRFRERQKEQKTLPCNGNVTNSNALETNCNTEIEIEKDIDIELEKEIDNTETKVSCCNKVQPIIDKWNSLNLNKLVSINSGTKRHTMLNARLKEYGLNTVLEAIDNINRSSFLKGQNNRSWVATFDWFVKPNNFLKVLEGNYIDKEDSNGGGRQDIKSSKEQLDFSKYEG